MKWISFHLEFGPRDNHFQVGNNIYKLTNLVDPIHGDQQGELLAVVVVVAAVTVITIKQDFKTE